MYFTTERSAVSIGEEQNGTISANSTARLEFSGSGAEGVTIRICIERGAIMVHGSYTDPNPSAAYYDFSYLLMAVEGEVTASSCSSTHVTMDNVTRATEDCDQCSGRERGKQKILSQCTLQLKGLNEFSVNSSIGVAFGKE